MKPTVTTLFSMPSIFGISYLPILLCFVLCVCVCFIVFMFVYIYLKITFLFSFFALTRI